MVEKPYSAEKLRGFRDLCETVTYMFGTPARLFDLNPGNKKGICSLIAAMDIPLVKQGDTFPVGTLPQRQRISQLSQFSIIREKTV